MAHLSEVAVAKINEICNRYVNENTPLMMILSDIQREYGYIPLEVQELVSKNTGISVAEIYGVVTFYSFFSLSPKGKYVIGCCLGTACYVKGAQQVIDKFSEILDYKNLGEICLSYPGENWKIKEEYSLIKHKDSGTVIRLIPYYNPKNFEEYQSLLKANFEDADSFSLQETELNGFRSLCCQYSDILGYHLEVIADFGIQLEASSAFGVRLSVSSDSPETCINEEALSILHTLSPSVPVSPFRFSDE